MRDQITSLLMLGVVVAAVTPCDAQEVLVPTFEIGRPVFGDHMGEVEVAPRPDGSFLVVTGEYDSGPGGGDSKDHAASRAVSADGVPLGPPRQIDTSGHVLGPAVSPDGLGGFAAAWQWISNEYLFFAQLLDASGAPRGPDFEMTLDLAGYPVKVGTVVGTPGGPVFLWDENGFGARAIDQNRTRRGGDVRIGDSAYKVDVASLPDGGFVVAWYDGFPPSRGRVFGPNGMPRGAEFVLSDTLAVPRVAASPRGGFAFVGQRVDATGSASELWVRRFADDGTPIGDEIHVHTAEPDVFVQPDLTFDERGNLYVAWGECCSFSRPIRARLFDTAGAPIGGPVDV